MNKPKKSIFREIYYQAYYKNPVKLYNHAKDNVDFIQRLGLQKKLKAHTGCVNTLSWNDSGQYILSGSDDLNLVITDGHNYKQHTKHQTSHRANIFSAKFLPHCNDMQIISCSGDGILLHTDLANPLESNNNQFNCHSGTTYEVITVPNDPNSFLSCGEDGTVRWYDLRVKSSCKKASCKDDILVSSTSAVTALGINPITSHQLSVGCSDSTVRLYDRRFISTYSQRSGTPESQPYTLFSAPDMENRRHRITSLNYSTDGQEILVSYSCDHLYLFNLCDHNVKTLKKPQSNWNKIAAALTGKRQCRSPPPVRRLRLRGDWSDTGPDARPERETNNAEDGVLSQARPQLQDTLMQRMTDVLARMLNDPMTRAALSGGGEENLDQQQQEDGGGGVTEAATVGETVTTSEAAGPGGVITAAGESTARGDPDAFESLVAGAARVRSSATITQSPSDGNTPTLDSDSRQMATHTTTTTLTSQSQSQSLTTPSSSSCPSGVAPTTTTTTTGSTTTTTTSGRTQHNVNTTVLTQQLRNRLTLLRHLRQGFIDQHGGEPSVSLRYSGQSTSNSTINLSPSIVGQGGGGGVARRDDCVNEDGLPRQMLEDTDMDLDYGGDCDIDSDKLEQLEEFQKEMEERQHVFEPHMKIKYTGHRNARTMIKEATFWGNDHVMSGSDCGHVFVWDRHTAELRMLLQADSHVVNCLQPHPTLPLLATSGIDHDIKLWGPVLDEPSFDVDEATNLIRRNEIMLEETRDTITVPAAFMIRMLACLNQIRHGSRNRTRTSRGGDDADEPC